MRPKSIPIDFIVRILVSIFLTKVATLPSLLCGVSCSVERKNEGIVSEMKEDVLDVFGPASLRKQYLIDYPREKSILLLIMRVL